MIKNGRKKESNTCEQCEASIKRIEQRLAVMTKAAMDYEDSLDEELDGRQANAEMLISVAYLMRTTLQATTRPNNPKMQLLRMLLTDASSDAAGHLARMHHHKEETKT